MFQYSTQCVNGMISEDGEWVIGVLEDWEGEKADSWHKEGKGSNDSRKVAGGIGRCRKSSMQELPTRPSISQPRACDKLTERRGPGVSWCQRMCQPQQHLSVGLACDSLPRSSVLRSWSMSSRPLIPVSKQTSLGEDGTFGNCCPFKEVKSFVLAAIRLFYSVSCPLTKSRWTVGPQTSASGAAYF
jgi:hypothetical protein